MANERAGLTRQDLDLLIEAVESWERDEHAADVLFDLVSVGMARSAHEAEKIRREREAASPERNRTKRTRKDRSVILRAKLIALRDGLEADELLGEAGGGGAARVGS